MAIKYQYLVDPLLGFQTKNGSLNTAGIINVYDAATDDPAVTYKDFVGTRNAQDIRLDDNGRAVIICDDSRAYRVEVRDQYGGLLYTQSPMYAKGGGGGAMGGIDIISSDETVKIEATSEGGVKTFDLSVDKDDPEYVVCDSYYVMGSGSTGSGYIVPQNMSDGNMTVDSRGILLIGGHHYHIDAWLTVTADPDSANPSNEYRQREMTLNFRFAADGTPVDMVFDNSFAHSDSFTLSGDLHPTSDVYLKIYFDNYEWADYSNGSMPSSHISMPRIDVHSIVGSYNGTGGGPGGSLPPATPADEGKVLTVDEDGLPQWADLPSSDVAYSVDSASQASWDVSTSYASTQFYISNGGDNSGIEYYLDGQDRKAGYELLEGHVYQVNFNCEAVCSSTSNNVWEGSVYLTGAQDQNWYFQLDGSQNIDVSLTGATTIHCSSDSVLYFNARLNGSNLSSLPTLTLNKVSIVDLTSTLSSGGGGGGDTPQYRPGAGIDIDDDVISVDTDEIQEKLTAGVNIEIDSDNIISTGKTVVAAGSNVSVSQTYDGLTKTTTYTVSSQQGEQPVQSDWNELNDQSLAFIRNKPDLSNFATQSDLAGKQDVLTPGANITIQNNVISANPQRQADWDQVDSSAVDYIRNKPTIPSGNQLLPAATSSDEDKVLTVDSNGDPVWAASQGGTQVQSDWTEDDVSEASYIQHKPNTKPIQAGTGISVVEYADNIRISGTVDPQVQSDWSENDNTEPDFIKNKPGVKQIVAGTNVTITEGVGQITISSTGAGGVPVQANWNQADSSQPDYIQNKPSIPAAQVQSDWTETSTSSPSFVLHKPVTKPIVAGNGISITETATEIIISLA